MKYITAIFIFLVFNASWQWWALMIAWMCMEGFMLVAKFRDEYKKQKSLIDAEAKPITKKQLEEVWNNGYTVGIEHGQIRKH